MANGIIAQATWQDCPKCVNHYGEKFCYQADSVKLNLRLDPTGDIRCGLFTERAEVEA